MAEPAPLTRSVAAPIGGEPARLATGARRIRQRQLRRLCRNPLSVAGAAIVLLLTTCAAAPTLLAPFPEDAGPNVHFERALQPPGRQHWFGTDDVGRDVLSRAVFGARVSLSLATVVLGIALGVGIPLGLYAGYCHGRPSSAVIMRVTDIFLSVPPLALALAAAAAFKPDLTGAMVAISFTWWPWFTRLVYGEVLVKREEPYVEAARALGHRDSVIAVKQILPNIISPIVVKATLDVSFVILLGSSLAFLGLGAQEPTPDWGAMVARGRTFLPEHWWLSTMPGLAVFVAVMGFNLLGDALRDALDVWE